MDQRDEPSRSSFRISVTINQANDSSIPEERQTDSPLPQSKPHSSNQQQVNKTKFRYVQPHNHKSALFVNLNDINKQNDSISGDSGWNRRDHLFISPELGQPQAKESQIANLESGDTIMSRGCNFITCIMQSSSHSGVQDVSSSPPDLDELDQSERNDFNNVTPNNLSSQDDTNKTIAVQDDAMDIPDQLDYCIIDDSDLRYNEDPEFSDSELEAEVRDLLNDIDLEQKLVDLNCENEALEERVADMERERLRGNSRTVVEEIIRRRRMNRELNTEIYVEKMRLKDAGIDVQGFNSDIRPGIEDTADILDVVPPPGQLQYCEMLDRAHRFRY